LNKNSSAVELLLLLWPVTGLQNSRKDKDLAFSQYIQF
jgi:hypothetical protein